MKALYTILFIAITATGLYAQKDISNNIEVRPVGKNLVYDNTQMLYALPKNVVQVELSVLVTSYIKGPYAGYAEKLLNISEGVSVIDHTIYEIGEVCIKRYSVMDSTQFYTILNINPFNIPNIQLNEDGVILACNSSLPVEGYSLAPCTAKRSYEEIELPVFTDLGLKPFMYEKSETLYKKVMTDTNEVEMPYTHKKLVATTTQMDAEEAAAFIRKIRKRKSKLLFGLSEDVNAVSGKTLKIMLNELDDLEQRYLELFMGKELSYEQKYYFDFEPGAAVIQERKLLCWFSRNKGVSLQKPDGKSGKFDQVNISSSVMGLMVKPQIELIDSKGKSPESIRYGLYYRVPGRVNFNVKVGQNIVVQKQMQIAQKGPSVPLPVDYIKDANFSILYYPELGALKSITKLKE